MTEKDNLANRINDLESELMKRDEKINTYLDKIEHLEVELMNYEEMFDESASKKKLKKVLEENCEIIIKKLREHIKDEDEVLYTIALSELTPAELQQLFNSTIK